MKKIAALLLTGAFAVNCSPGDTGASYTEHFIQDYTIANDIDKIGLYDMGKRSFYIGLKGENVGYKDQGEKGEKFHRLAEKYGDMSFNSRIVPGTIHALANELTTISIVSDAAYDDLHPAGTPLDDIVYFSGESYYSFIEAGYKGSWTTSFDKSLAQLSESDLKLLNARGGGLYAAGGLSAFYFSAPPTVSWKHNMTLTITDADGDAFSTTKFIDFDDPTMWVQ